MGDHRTIKLYRLSVLLADLLAALLALPIARGLTALRLGTDTGLIGGGPMLAAATISMIFGIWSMRGYHLERIFRIADEVTTLFLGAAVGMGVFAGLLFFTSQDTPPTLVANFAITTPFLALLLRAGWRVGFKWRQAPRVPTARVLVVGAGTLGRQIGRQLGERAWLGLELVGYVDDDAGAEGLTLGALEELETLCETQDIDVVIVSLPLDAHHHLADLLERVHKLPVQIKLVPDIYPLAYLYSRLEMFGGMPLIGIAEPVISPVQAAVKRAIDVLIATLALVLSAPFLLMIALLIRLSSRGPSIFKQKRVGQGGKIFYMYKFRTMVENAEEILLKKAEDDRSVLVKSANDPRVTSIGRWLRRLSLDELPQLWNVLIGDMSIVGPRPELPYLVEQYEPWQRKRLMVPQGITGWWQINGRSEKPLLYHTEDDLYYIRNYSLLLDLEILWKTIWVVLRGRGAY